MKRVGGRYGMHSGSGKFKNLEATGNFWFQGNSMVGTPGNIWYVNSSASSNGSGKSWDSPFDNIASAVSAAGEKGDIIYVAPGDYPLSSTIAIAKDNLSIIGPNKSCNDYAALIYNDDAFDLMSIDSNNVSIMGLGFAPIDDAGVGIAIAGTTVAYKVYIAHCRFDGWGKGTYAITTDDTQDSPDLTVEHCYFRSWVTGCIYANSTRDLYRNNMFYVTTDTMGIQYVPTTGLRPDGRIMDNDFVGVANASTTAIAFTGTPTAGTLIMARNMLAGSWDVTIEAESTDAGVQNFEGTTTGGTVIDCNSSA